MKHALICLLLLTICFAGCFPGVKVRKNPRDSDLGIRFYRPKPYLLITPQGATTYTYSRDGKKIATSTSGPTDETVGIELQYLPDFSEEYSLQVRPGLGTATVKFELEDGWKLTMLNQELDSKVADNLKAVGSLLDSIGNVASINPTEGTVEAKGMAPKEVTTRWVVNATNVPIGYYEAVISKECGVKKLFGWRYVGFAPFNTCAIPDCNSDFGAECGSVFGLVFDHGVMVFKPLANLTIADSTRSEVATGTVQYSGGIKNTSGVTGGTSHDVQQQMRDSKIAELVNLNLRAAGLPNVEVQSLFGRGLVVLSFSNAEVLDPQTIENITASLKELLVGELEWTAEAFDGLVIEWVDPGAKPVPSILN